MSILVGILNITQDSFSDGGLFFSPDHALQQAELLHQSGAAIVELGPASSNPDAKEVSASEEVNRCSAVIEQLRRRRIPFGVDSYRAETQIFAAENGAVMINDIHGFPDTAVYPQLRACQAKLVVMHSMQSSGIANRSAHSLQEVQASMYSFFGARIEALLHAGIERTRILIDPGMGFFLSRDPNVSIAVLQSLKELREEFSMPLFVSVSRKSFLRAIAGCDVSEALPATLAAELYCERIGVEYIRTHDVKALIAAIAIQNALASKTI